MSERVFPLSSGRAAWESSIAQTWAVTEKKTASGRRRAISNQLYPSYTFSVDFTLDDAEISQLAGFYASCKGGLLPFWYKDFGAHAEMQELARDANGAYQCVSINGGYIEACQKVDNLRVYVDGTETLDYSESGGLITLSAGTEVRRSVCASYNYYRCVKFAGELSVKQLAPDINSVSLKLESVR